MRRLIRPTYPIEFSIGLLSLIFIISCLVSHQIFNIPLTDQSNSIFIGMFLVGTAVIIMVLIVWEEFLFPIKVKEINGGIIFRNHRTKLKTQLLIYCSIPAIFAFIYYEYEVHYIRFFICAAICIVSPIIEKIASGINNYNDFLKLTHDVIQYKDNDREGTYNTKEIKNISIIRDDRNVINKIDLLLTNNDHVIIDIDKMELDAFYDSINKFITLHYSKIVKDTKVADLKA